MKEYHILSRCINHGGGQWTDDLAAEMNNLSREKWRLEGTALSDNQVLIVMARETPQPLFRDTKKAGV